MKELRVGSLAWSAAKAAVEAVDTCVGRVAAAVDEMGGVLLITADHGNADKMVDTDGEPFTAHTTNPVPFCVVGYPCTLREGGVLADIAPTMLKIMGLPQPEEMTGKSIILWSVPKKIKQTGSKTVSRGFAPFAFARDSRLFLLHPANPLPSLCQFFNIFVYFLVQIC